MVGHIAVHGNAAISDGAMPVVISYSSQGAIAKAPSTATLPYTGKVHFTFQNPPIPTSQKGFTITSLEAEVVTNIADFKQVDLYSGGSHLNSFPVPPLKVTALGSMGPYESDSGLDVAYVITFKATPAGTPPSSVLFNGVDIEYN